jgi:hypothetical protein
MAVSSKPGASTNAQTVYNALRAKGYSNAAAAGAVGNLQQESGVNPGSVQPGGAGRGIAQWGTGPGSGQRWDNLTAWANSTHQNPWALSTQTTWLEQDLSKAGMGPGSAYAKGTNVGTATSQFETGIEQAGTVAMSQRVGYAQNAYAAFSNNGVTATTPATGKGYSAIPGVHAAPSSGKKAATPSTQNPILHGLSNIPGDVAGLPGDVGNWAGSAASDVGGAVSNAAGDVSSVPKAIGKVTTTLFSVSFWIRVAFIIVGIALVFIGTKALLTGSPPQMPGTNDNTPTPQKAAPVRPKASFGKNISHGVADVGEVAA